MAESSEIRTNDPILTEKTLKEMGFIAQRIAGWNRVVYPKKVKVSKLLNSMNYSDITIQIGEETINCELIVLQCYSKLFRDINSNTIVQLPEDQISISSFIMAYEWMQADKPVVQRLGIIELYNAATFLEMDDLVRQIWTCFDSQEVFCESAAFFLCPDARKYGMMEIEQIMLTRICKFFLTLVATYDFLQLNSKEVCALLKSNALGVNAEVEVFMSAMFWLNHNWKERRVHVVPIMSTVRFGLIPPWYLAMLTKSTEKDVQRVIIDSRVQDLMGKGLSYSIMLLYYKDSDPRFLDFLEKYKLSKLTQRQWIYDRNCSYHHYQNCPNTMELKYDAFVDYLSLIQTYPIDYWRTLEMATTDGELPYACCKRAKNAFSPSPVSNATHNVAFKQ